jgi:hypothetical protein
VRRVDAVLSPLHHGRGQEQPNNLKHGSCTNRISG